MGSSVLYCFHHHFPQSIDTSPPVSSLLLGWITPCASSGHVPLVTSLVSESWAVPVMVLGRVPVADDPLCETEGRGVDSCPVSSAIFSWDSDSGDRWHWPSSVCLSLQDPWLRASPLRQPARYGFFRQPQPAMRFSPSRPSTGLGPSSGMLHCALVASAGQFSNTTTFAETPLLEVCPAKVGPRYFVSHQHFSWRS